MSTTEASTPVSPAAPGPNPALSASDPRLGVLSILAGKQASQVVYAVAKLGVADLLVGGPRTARQLAEPTGTDPLALYRILRFAAVVGVLTESDDGRFGLTELGEVLRSDNPDGLRNHVISSGDDCWWRPYGDILTSVRTGGSAFEHVHGTPVFEWLDNHPEVSRTLHAGVTEMNRWVTSVLLASYDFGRYRRIADLGGGHGYFLSQLLRSYPEVTGLLLDRPSIVEHSRTMLREQGVADRAEVIGGDIFAAVPGGYDAYMYKAVLLNWPDEAVTRTFEHVRKAIGDNPDGRLLVLEEVLSPSSEAGPAAYHDIEMLVNFGGGERTEEHWRALLDRAGFELVERPRAGIWGVLECRPV